MMQPVKRINNMAVFHTKCGSEQLAKIRFTEDILAHKFHCNDRV